MGLLFAMVLLNCLLVSFACLVVEFDYRGHGLRGLCWRFAGRGVVWCTNVCVYVLTFGIAGSWCFLSCIVVVV